MSATATVPAKPQTLDELMLAMDVVDTIRHRELLVERELGQGERDAALRGRLREIYKAQGIEVTDVVIDQGIKALRESRFVYTPPAPSLGRSLALVWINRGRIVGWTAVILIGVAALWGVYQVAVVAPAERARIELVETLPKSLQTAYDGVRREARVAAATSEADAFLAQGRTALTRQDADGARAAVASLQALQSKLAQTYTLRVVDDAERDSGITRQAAEGGNNYYLIVEAIGPDGKPLTLPIENVEDGRTYNVSAWGVRVPEEVYERVGRDARDNGIIDDRVLGEKMRGELEPRYRMTALGGKITSW